MINETIDQSKPLDENKEIIPNMNTIIKKKSFITSQNKPYLFLLICLCIWCINSSIKYKILKKDITNKEKIRILLELLSIVFAYYNIDCKHLFLLSVTK